MSYSEILYNVAEGVATVTLNRPQKLNAWTTTMEQEVAEAMQAAEADPGVRVIVLTGAGRGFCAGADLANLDGLAQSNNTAETLKELMGKRFGPKPRAGVRQDFQQTYSYLLAIEKPILCAINGPVAGLGLVITLYCDLRFASDQARFSTAFARRGLIAEHGISWLLPRLVGVSNALDLLYSARLIDAAEALRIGLVNRVIPQAEFEAEVRKYALELASASSPRSTRVIKRQVYNAIFQNLSEAIETANEEMVQSFASRDFKEGVAHFLEKRPPAFTGK
ncbi:MAG TPA: enoyl-CoA hydratase [Pirellulales bacterium]|jgi:enoyl-CoA hydratase/carnithine racemase|nr:enoyl-CoA hydratase [Pirellulales bacterium]